MKEEFFSYFLHIEELEILKSVIQKMKPNFNEIKNSIIQIIRHNRYFYFDCDIIEYLFFESGINGFKNLEEENKNVHKAFSLNEAFEFHIKNRINMYVIGFLYGGYSSRFVNRLTPNLFYDILNFLR